MEKGLSLYSYILFLGLDFVHSFLKLHIWNVFLSSGKPQKNNTGYEWSASPRYCIGLHIYLCALIVAKNMKPFLWKWRIQQYSDKNTTLASQISSLSLRFRFLYILLFLKKTSADDWEGWQPQPWMGSKLHERACHQFVGFSADWPRESGVIRSQGWYL